MKDMMKVVIVGFITTVVTTFGSKLASTGFDKTADAFDKRFKKKEKRRPSTVKVDPDMSSVSYKAQYCRRKTAGAGGKNVDGTPDKRFKKQGKTKKDGTLDLRFKENW